MKLLFDQNISFRILKKLSSVFPNASQVKQEQLENATDKEIWDYAKRTGFTIVTFDSDFYDYSVIWGAPPKIVLIKSFNQTTNHLCELLIKHKQEVLSLAEDTTIDCLEIK